MGEWVVEKTLQFTFQALTLDSVQYPPKGFRGVGLARAQGYGTDFEGYKKWN